MVFELAVVCSPAVVLAMREEGPWSLGGVLVAYAILTIAQVAYMGCGYLHKSARAASRAFTYWSVGFACFFHLEAWIFFLAGWPREHFAYPFGVAVVLCFGLGWWIWRRYVDGYV